MLTTTNSQSTLWESILPEAALRMTAELGRVDELLDDAVFFEPFRPHFDPVMGRPSIPMETYLRMMFLKVRYGLGYESLCREVADSISWQRFSRIPLGAAVPHPTTLVKITRRCGEKAIDALNETLLRKAAGERLVKVDRVRADTTVVEANVGYPTDSGLLTKAIGKMSRAVKALKDAGLAGRTGFRDRRRAAGRRAHEIAASLRKRSEEAKGAAKEITGELAVMATLVVAQALVVARNARRSLRRDATRATARIGRVLSDLETTIARTQRIIEQTNTRLCGEVPDGKTRLVSLTDPDARPIRKGRLDRPTEFGYKAQIVDNSDGLILDHRVEVGAPPDAPQLAPAIRRITTLLGRAPRAVTADRGYGEAAVQTELEDIGVGFVAIPRKGRPGKARQAEEHRPRFRRIVKWRTGAEGRISTAKRSYGWRRTLLTGISGARIWCGGGVFVHNLVKITVLRAERVAVPAAGRNVAKTGVHPNADRQRDSATSPRVKRRRRSVPFAA